MTKRPANGDIGALEPLEAPALRVAVLTRAGRPSGRRMAEAVVNSSHELVGVLAERRTTMLWKSLKRGDFFKRVGLGFVLSRFQSAMRAPLGRRRFHSGRSLPEGKRQVLGSLNSARAVSLLKMWNVDVLVVANAPVLRPEVFTCSGTVALNFHSGRLPEYGGVASEFWALYNGEAAAWVTLHRVGARLDSGAIVSESAVAIREGDTPEALHDRCVEEGARRVVEVLDQISRGTMVDVRIPGKARLLTWPSSEQRRHLSQVRLGGTL